MIPGLQAALDRLNDKSQAQIELLRTIRDALVKNNELLRQLLPSQETTTSAARRNMVLDKDAAGASKRYGEADSSIGRSKGSLLLEEIRGKMRGGRITAEGAKYLDKLRLDLNISKSHYRDLLEAVREENMQGDA